MSKNQYLEGKNQKIENPRQSSYKDPIKGDFYKNQTKKSSTAWEKELLEDMSPSPSRCQRISKDFKDLEDLADSLLVPNHQNPGSELESSKPVRVTCLVW